MSDYDIAVHARAVAGDANYDHAPVIHDLCAELATLRTRLAEVEAENERLRELARRVLRHNVESRWGICDAVDNDGRRYQSQALADDILNLRAALAQPKESRDG